MTPIRLFTGLASLTLAFAVGCASPESSEVPTPVSVPSARVAAPAQEVVLVELTGLT